MSCGEEKKVEKGTVPTLITVDKKPNVIIVFTDDQGYGDLAAHGNPYIKTPNLSAFGKEAMELTNFHVGTTCAPSRAGLMTGRNGNRNNAWHTIAGCSILLEDEKTIAQFFEEGGYKTAMFGKWHLWVIIIRLDLLIEVFKKHFIMAEAECSKRRIIGTIRILMIPILEMENQKK
ncbi:sulfatase-like hydrolase/transferase [Zobellia laminariae]|uniref:sulfatase-like hydrolase/transferase n=1 Tax=Zobellia laminariae TaxID=248906 RepID=UPI0026F472BD|nr:sulfatase-like hydrolase/transferase [Zobellia laminariae]WKX75473.1 sulfatase-like hydrolase/transferase [Zobellia laminariae]